VQGGRKSSDGQGAAVGGVALAAAQAIAAGKTVSPSFLYILVPPRGLLPCIYAVILSFLHILVSQNGLLLCILPVRDHDSISLWSVLQAHHHRCELTLCRSLQEKHLTNFYRFQQKEKRRSGEHRPPRLSILFLLVGHHTSATSLPHGESACKYIKLLSHYYKISKRWSVKQCPLQGPTVNATHNPSLNFGRFTM